MRSEDQEEGRLGLCLVQQGTAVISSQCEFRSKRFLISATGTVFSCNGKRRMNGTVNKSGFIKFWRIQIQLNSKERHTRLIHFSTVIYVHHYHHDKLKASKCSG